MEQEERDFADGPPRRGSVRKLKGVAGCLLLAMFILGVIIAGLFGMAMLGARND
jgi:hypothetical protein